MSPSDENQANVTLGGEPWLIFYSSTLDVSLWGLTHHDERVIELSPRLQSRMELDATLHECLHAVAPWLDEDFVEDTATEIANILWKMGYRK